MLADELVGLETFDPKAFQSDGTFPQSVCNLVLSLSLVYNDFRDIYVAHDAINKSLLNEPLRETKLSGEISGLRVHLLRIQAGIIFELFNLIEHSVNAIEEPIFNKIISKINKQGREAWTALKIAAINHTSTGEVGHSLLFLRNKIAFHYDPKEIFKGYSNAFLSPTTKRIPYVSRGSNLQQTRFYFADASAQDYMVIKASNDEVKAFINGRAEVFNHVHIAIYEIVTKYIQLRGYGWRQIEKKV
ncbi:MAG: hypothetical protein Q8O92_12105 [Candidatus Latescibacter sp.]|nr:hypothetical protein [Candidatus Latescibacter sp.]